MESTENFDKICSALKAISVQHDVEILFAVEEGSRAWGLASPDSDHDIKFVYAHKPGWYFQLEEGREIIDESIDNGKIDLNGWDIRKAMRMLRDSNCSILTWLNTSIIYEKNDLFFNDALTLGMKCISWKSLAFHFLNKAKKHLREYFEGDRWKDEIIEKKYFFVLHPLLSIEWMRQHRKEEFPPMQFSVLLNSITIDNEVKGSIENLASRKIQNNIGNGPRLVDIDNWIKSTLVATEQYAAKELQIVKPFPFLHFNEIIAKYILNGEENS